MNGWLLVDKPTGATSHTIVDKVRSLIDGCCIGHTGTLDPFATGLLVLGIGHATRLSEYVIKQSKKYTAVVRLGQTTTTYDIDGEIIDEKSVNINMLDINNALVKFQGSVQQIPPIYSAIKINGERAYKLARAGKAVKMKSRLVHIYQINLINYNMPDVMLEISCSSGTYVRSIAHDLGQVLGCGAHLLSLCRNQLGGLQLNNAYTMDQISEASSNESINSMLIAAGDALPNWKSLVVDEDTKKNIRHGNSFKCSHSVTSDLALAYDKSGELIAVVEGQPDFGNWQPRKVFLKQ